MTREEAKKLMPVIQAFADGKDVETKTGSGWMSIENMSFAGKPDSYRIKPEPKYRSFANAEECLQEMPSSRKSRIPCARILLPRACATT